MTPQPDLTLILPAFNEARRLPRALDTLRSFAQGEGLTLEIVVSSDGSTDDTMAVAERYGAQPGPGFSVVPLEIPHRGKGAAVRAGMQRSTGVVTGFCDVDLSAGPDAISVLYRAIQDGAQVAIASRGMPDSVLVRRQPLVREYGGRVFNLALRRLAHIPFHDTQCGLKLFRAEVALELFRHQRLDGFAFDAELVVLASRLGFSVAEIPIRWSHDEDTRISYVRDSWEMTSDIYRIVRRLGRGEVIPLGIPADSALDQMTSGEDTHWWHVAKRQLVGQLIGAAPQGRCLDVGCGGGAMVAEAATRVPAFGIDLSDRALSHAQVRGLRLLVRGEAAHLPFASGSFATALALDVIEHHPDPDALLREVGRVLADDGVLIVTVPAFSWMWSYADHVLGHYRRYVRPQLAQELEASGFRLERLTYFHSWLLPAAWGFRKLKAAAGRTESADDFAVPGPLNRILLGLATAEAKVLARRDIPFGLSLLAVARPVRMPGEPVQAALAASADTEEAPAVTIGGSAGSVAEPTATVTGIPVAGVISLADAEGAVSR